MNNLQQLIEKYERIRDNGTFDEAAYYNPFIADLRSLQSNDGELKGYLKRLITAAKPHCVPTSTLRMRVVEAEQALNNQESKT